MNWFKTVINWPVIWFTFHIFDILPYFILKVVNPAARARSWWPRQMPKIGLRLVCRTRRKLAMVRSHLAGSPGPLLMKSPSYSSGLMGWSHGTTSTRAPRARKQRNWWYFNPQSTAQMRGLPPALYVFVFYIKHSKQMIILIIIIMWFNVLS